MQSLFLALFLLLVFSMFLPRIGLLFGWVVPYGFIGIQIGCTVPAVLLHGALTLGLDNALTLVGFSTGAGFAVEWIGLRKGWVFGRYRYTDKIGPRLFGVVPVFVPPMWGILSYMGFWTAKLFLFCLDKTGPISGAAFILAASAVITLWDLAADPLLVREGAWVWERPGSYYGIPLSNFIGWFGTACALYAAILARTGGAVLETPAATLLEPLPVLGYSVMTGVFAAACFERRMVFPGLVGSACAGLAFVLTVVSIF